MYNEIDKIIIDGQVCLGLPIYNNVRNRIHYGNIKKDWKIYTEDTLGKPQDGIRVLLLMFKNQQQYGLSPIFSRCRLSHEMIWKALAVI